jgi:hypothetical protein
MPHICSYYCALRRDDVVVDRSHDMVGFFEKRTMGVCRVQFCLRVSVAVLVEAILSLPGL